MNVNDVARRIGKVSGVDGAHLALGDGSGVYQSVWLHAYVLGRYLIRVRLVNSHHSRQSINDFPVDEQMHVELWTKVDGEPDAMAKSWVDGHDVESVVSLVNLVAREAS